MSLLPPDYDPATAEQQLACLSIPLLPALLGRLVELTRPRLWPAAEYERGYNAVSEEFIAMLRGECLRPLKESIDALTVRVDTYLSPTRYSATTDEQGNIVYSPPIAPAPTVDDANTPYQVLMDVRAEQQLQTPVIREQRDLQQEARDLLLEISGKIGQDTEKWENVIQLLGEIGVALA